MVYSLTYRRPAYVSSSRGSLNGDEKAGSFDESIRSGSSGATAGIPEALSFDKIISGGVCPPCTLRDFMNYLKYIEHAPENLQFFLWHKDYSKRFAALPDSQRALAPEWTQAQAEAEIKAQADVRRSQKPNPETAAMFKGTAFDNSTKPVDSEKLNPFHTPDTSRTPSRETKRTSDAFDGATTDGRASSTLASKSEHARRAETAFEDAGLKWQPFSVQPFREEMSRIISIYIAEGAPRQLNISGRERASLLHALEHTTHPTAFCDVVKSVEWSLRFQAHPNFIRWTICNGNRPRVIFARGLGVGGIILGLLAAILITLSSAGRGWRVLSFIGFFIGTSTLIAAWKGMCVVLHGMHHRHLRPWELFVTDDDDMSTEMKYESFSSLESAKSYEDEPWVVKYEKRNVIRKVFDREVWIEEPALRGIQDTIFLQAMLGSFVISAIAVGIFCAIPHGNFY